MGTHAYRLRFPQDPVASWVTLSHRIAGSAEAFCRTTRQRRELLCGDALEEPARSRDPPGVEAKAAGLRGLLDIPTAAKIGRDLLARAQMRAPVCANCGPPPTPPYGRPPLPPPPKKANSGAAAALAAVDWMPNHRTPIDIPPLRTTVLAPPLLRSPPSARVDGACRVSGVQ